MKVKIKALSRLGVLGLVSFLFVECANGKDNSAPTTGKEGTISLTIDLAKIYQTIDNFAASDAWAGQFVGNWPDAKRNAIADLLFSNEFTAAGQPKGIGLSQWRFNIGAGSGNEGNTSHIGDEWRSAESFLNDDGTYNWERQAGQMWLLNAAKERGVNQFLAFPNSPPVQLTVNGKAFATSGKPNLAPANFDSYADYLATVIKGVQTKTGILFDYISPVNEPQWEWSEGGQEGTPFKNSDISGIVRSLNTALENEKLSTKIVVAEAAQYEFLYADHGRPGQGKQIDAFFNPSSLDYIGDLSKVDNIISAHSYFTTSPLNQAISIRKQVSDQVSKFDGLKLWQSEYCILGDNAGDIEGNVRDLGIASALYVARTIHNDLVVANATAWQWWLAISPYNYKDGLVYVDKNKTDGNYYSSKILWALGNYSRFIRPGAVRVDVSTDNNRHNEKLFISSYRSQDEKQLVTVIVNSDTQPFTLNLAVQNGSIGDTKSYVTSEEADLAPKTIVNSNEVIVSPRSVITLVSTII